MHTSSKKEDIPRFDQVRKGKHRAQDNADAADDDVRDAHERVLPADHGGRGEHDGLCAVEQRHGEVYNIYQHTQLLKKEDGKHTIGNIQLIQPLLHRHIIIPPRELAKRRQPRRAHPHLELLVLLQVRRWVVLGVVVRVPLEPVRRRRHLVPLVRRRLEDGLVRRPRDAAVRHRVRLVAAVAGADRLRERVVEQRVRDQATGKVGLSLVVELERVARAALDRGVGDEDALELVQAQRLDVAPVVLVEVGEAVVEEDSGADVVWDLKRDGAHGHVEEDAPVDLAPHHVLPPRRLRRHVVRAEAVLDLAGGYGRGVFLAHASLRIAV